jgi:hypothetical protein
VKLYRARSRAAGHKGGKNERCAEPRSDPLCHRRADRATASVPVASEAGRPHCYRWLVRILRTLHARGDLARPGARQNICHQSYWPARSAKFPELSRRVLFRNVYKHHRVQPPVRSFRPAEDLHLVDGLLLLFQFTNRGVQRSRVDRLVSTIRGPRRRHSTHQQ